MENIESDEAKSCLNNSTLLTNDIRTIIKKEENECDIDSTNCLNPEITLGSSNVSGGSSIDSPTLIKNDEFSQITKQDTMLSPHLISNQKTVERKEYSEREITYNLLLRRLVDEYLDRKVTYSHQPKYILGILKCVLGRNFPEFSNSFHRERICAYLKACRRKVKRKNGEPYVRVSARYLSSGRASTLAETIYMKEYNYLTSMISNPKNNHFTEQATPTSACCETTKNEIQNPSNLIHHQPQQFYESHLQQVDSQKTSNMMSCNDNYMKINNNYDNSEALNEEISTSSNPISQQHADGNAFVKLLEQTAGFLLLMADCLDAGQGMFTSNKLYDVKP
ncbi:unnamed protein product [Schistosoma turkestanicum]|nr:unnamed protein product [Schistosoma turkestanicum]